MIRHGHWKLVYQPLESGYLLRLFNLETDPSCQHDVLPAHPDVKEALWERLRPFVMTHA